VAGDQRQDARGRSFVQLARDRNIEGAQHADRTGQIDRVAHDAMGDDTVARPRGTVAEHDDFAVQEFDTGRGGRQGAGLLEEEALGNSADKAEPVVRHRVCAHA
jgi:hypothetical protein